MPSAILRNHCSVFVWTDVTRGQGLIPLFIHTPISGLTISRTVTSVGATCLTVTRPVLAISRGPPNFTFHSLAKILHWRLITPAIDHFNDDMSLCTCHNACNVHNCRLFEIAIVVNSTMTSFNRNDVSHECNLIVGL